MQKNKKKMRALDIQIIVACVVLVSVCLFGAEPRVFVFEENLKQDPAKEQLELGKQAVSEGLYSAARRYFSRFLELNGTREPEYGEGTLLKANACLLDGRPQEALNAIDEHAKKSPGLQDRELLQKLDLASAQAYAFQQNWEQTRKIAKKLIDEKAAEALLREAMLLYADAARNQNDWAEVIAVLKNCKLTDERAFPFVQRLARAYMETGNYVMSQKLLDDFKVNEGTQDAIIASLLRVQNLVKSKKIEGAKVIFGKLKERMPEKPDEDWWAAVLSLAGAYAEIKEYADAEKMYVYAVRLSPSTAKQRLTLKLWMEMNLQAGLVEKARGVLAILAERFPDSSERLELTVKLGVVLHAGGDYENAAYYFQQLIEYPHSYPHLRYTAGVNLGECLFEAGKWQEAVVAFNQADASAGTADEHAYVQMRAADVEIIIYREEKDENKKLEKGRKAENTLRNLSEKYAQSKHVKEAVFKRAGLLAEMSDFNEAASVYGKYAEKYADGLEAEEARLLQGRCLRKAATTQEERVNALKFLEKIAEKSSDAVRDKVLLEVASTAREADKGELAEKALALVLSNENAELAGHALFQRSCLRFEYDKIEEARLDAEKFLEKYSERVEECDRLSMLVGDSYANEGAWTDAVKYYSLPAEGKRTLYLNALYEMAVAEYHLEKYGIALAHIAALSAVAEIETVDNGMFWAKILYLKGDVLAARLDFIAAMEAYSSCWKKAGACILGYSALGRQGEMLMIIANIHKTEEIVMKSELKEAAGCFRRIVKDLATDSPHVPVAQIAEYNLAVCLARLGAVDEAIEVYENIYFLYRKNYVDFTGIRRKARPLDDHYVVNALVDMIALLEAKGDAESLDKVNRYRSFLAKRTSLPVSDTAKSRLER